MDHQQRIRRFPRDERPVLVKNPEKRLDRIGLPNPSENLYRTQSDPIAFVLEGLI